MANQDDYLRKLQRIDACGEPLGQKNYKQALERVVGLKSLEELDDIDSILDTIDTREAAVHEALIAIHEDTRLRDAFTRYDINMYTAAFDGFSIMYRGRDGLLLGLNNRIITIENSDGKLIYAGNNDLVLNYPQIDPLTIKTGIINAIKETANYQQAVGQDSNDESSEN